MRWLLGRAGGEVDPDDDIVGMTAAHPGICVVSANEATWADLQPIFGARGTGGLPDC